MGVDFVAIMDHKLTVNEIASLPQTLTKNRFGYGLGDESKHMDWQFDPYDKRPLTIDVAQEILDRPKHVPNSLEDVAAIEIHGPYSILYVSQHCLEFDHLLWRWGLFLKDDAVQIALRALCRELSRLVHGSRAIYVPDSSCKESVAPVEMLEQKMAFEEVEAFMLNEFGPPAASIRDIYIETEEFWDSEGYYIDRF
jgi:hypothetical protein